MMNKMTSKKISIIERVRQITSAALVVGGLLISGNVQGAVTSRSPVVDRAVAVQDALKEKLRTDAKATQKLPRAQVLLAQWGNNWANAWSNWDNWNNWRNWNNWANFGNWGNL